MGIIFISYSHVDSAIADKIVALMSEMGIQYFRDVKNIEWGTSINTEVRNALDKAAAVLVIVSPASLKSQWVPYEIGYATAMQSRILPYLTHPSIDVPNYIHDLNFCTSLEQVSAYFQTSFPPKKSRPNIEISSTSDSKFEKLFQILPDLLNEMRNDLKNDETKLIRECVVLPYDRVVFNGGGKRRFYYFENEHDDLQNKMALLEQNGFISDVTPGNTPIYRMTEDFVDLLTTHSEFT